MSKKQYVLKQTDKTCSGCKGIIIEVFSEKTEELTMNTPMGKLGNWVSSDGFCCQNCGCLYGGPMFPKTPSRNIGNDIREQFSFIEVTLKRRLKKGDISVGLDKIALQTENEFLGKNKGDILYFSYSDVSNSNFNDRTCLRGMLRLNPSYSSISCLVSKETFDFK